MFDALAMVTVCKEGPTEDLVAAASPHAREAKALMETVLRHDDNAEAFEAFRKLAGDRSAAAEVVRLALGVSEPLLWEAALRRERELLEGADPAWKTTSIAAEVEVEVMLQYALAEASAGQWLRHRFEAFLPELDQFAAIDRTIPAHGDPDRAGIPVTAALCRAADLPVPDAPPPPPIEPPPPPRAKGCAGCGASGSADGLVVLLVAFVVVRRTARRQVTPAG